MSSTDRATRATDIGIRPTIATLEGSRIGAIADYGRGRPGLIPLWFGEGDQPTPPFIRDAVTAALADGKTFYSLRRGEAPLRQALRAYLTRLHGSEIGLERIRVTPSGMSAIQIGMQALVEPGRNVVLVSPVWPNATAVARALGAEAREIPLERRIDGRWRLDPDRLFAACDDRTALLFLNSPGNPTGWMASRAEIATILTEARRRGLWVMADEVYSRIVFDGEAAPSFLDVAEPEDRVLVVNSFSKSWAMTGFRLGWLTMPESFAPLMDTVGEINTSSTSQFIQHAGAVAVTDGEPFIAEQRAWLARNRDLVMARLGQLPRVRIDRPEATFYAWFTVDGATDSMDLCKQLVDRANVGVAPGCAFGAGGDGWVRMCFAARTETLATALDRMAPVLA